MEGINEGKLKGTICSNCGTKHLPPRIICPNCGCRKLKWNNFNGDGVLKGYTIVNIAPSFMSEKVPYKIAIIKLDEGPGITAILYAEDSINVGDRVTAGYEMVDEKINLFFKPK